MPSNKLPPIGQLWRWQIHIDGGHERTTWHQVLYCPDEVLVTTLLLDSLMDPKGRHWQFATKIAVLDKERGLTWTREEWLDTHRG